MITAVGGVGRLSALMAVLPDPHPVGVSARVLVHFDGLSLGVLVFRRGVCSTDTIGTRNRAPAGEERRLA